MSSSVSTTLPFLAPLPMPPLPLPQPPQHPFAEPYDNFQLTAPPPPQPRPQAPSRAVVLSLLPGDVSEISVRRELEVVGEVRAVEVEWVSDGVVTVHFYDLRHAKRAVREIREQHDRAVPQREDSYIHPFLRGRFCGGKRVFGGRPVWAQFKIPVTSCIPEGQNQDTIVIFNLDPSVSANELRRTFGAFGLVKEFRDTPYKKRQRFVEFFDVRNASRALWEMNGKEINGRGVVIEFSRPGGLSGKFLNAAAAPSSSTFPIPNPNFASTSCYPPWTMNSPPQHHPKPLPSRTNQLMTKFSQGEGFYDGSSIEGSMCNLSLDASGSGLLEDYFAHDRKTGKKKLGGSKQQQQQVLLQQLKAKNWKGKRQMGKLDGRFAITDDDLMEEPGVDMKKLCQIYTFDLHD